MRTNSGQIYIFGCVDGHYPVRFTDPSSQVSWEISVVEPSSAALFTCRTNYVKYLCLNFLSLFGGGEARAQLSFTFCCEESIEGLTDFAKASSVFMSEQAPNPKHPHMVS